MTASPRIEPRSDRVRRHTSDSRLAAIDEEIRHNVRRFGQDVWSIDQRIRELDAEWDIERVLETNASILALAGVVLGSTVDRKWFLLTGGVLGFLLQHAVSGWCPPLPVLRRLGVRTRGEIDRERFALKALRGDFRGVPEQADAPSAALAAVEN